MHRLDSLFATPPRRSFGSGRGVVLGLLATGALATMTGCASAPGSMASSNPASRVFPARKPPKTAANASLTDANASLNAALAKIDASTVQAWFNRWTTPPRLASSPRPPEVRIDSEVLARHHPAWQLADALERGTISPSAPQIAAVLLASAPPSLLTPPAALGGELPTRPATLLRQNWTKNSVLKRQSAALDRFFAAASGRDALRGRDETFLARRALENSITAAQRGAVGELDLSLIPPEVALELTNLRLQLLRNLAKTPALRATARDEIAAIEERYAQIWRDQTALQAAKVRQMTLDLPAQSRREGLAKIAADSQSEAQNRASAHHEVEVSLKSRLEADFARRSDDLKLRLPAVTTIPPLNQRIGATNSQFFETADEIPPSSLAPDARPLASPRRFDRSLITRLRAQARSDAREWALLIAARWGSRWNNQAGRPNRTGAAVQALFEPRERQQRETIAVQKRAGTG